MIYIFVWERYFRQKLLNAWKKAFEEKHSIHNIIHIRNIFDYDLSFYEQNFLSSWFFASKNLFIIDDFPFNSWEDDKENTLKYVEYFLDILPKISNENVVVFNQTNIDKRSKLYKEIVKIWEIKDFSILNENDLLNKLNKVYDSKVSQNAINNLIKLKWINFSNISNELDKILITKDYIDLPDLKDISKDIEENIFEIINDILSLDTKKAILSLRELSSFLDNPYLLYNMLVANLRVYFYIFKLKSLQKSSKDIKDILDLWNRGFLVDKSYKITYNEFFKIYEKMISIDSRLKTWKLIWSEEKDMMYEIERSLIG